MSHIHYLSQSFIALSKLNSIILDSIVLQTENMISTELNSPSRKIKSPIKKYINSETEMSSFNFKNI